MSRRPGIAARLIGAVFHLPTSTVEGRFFLVGLVATGFLATVTDRNFVLLVLGLLFAVLLVALATTWRNLGRVEFQRRLPKAVIAGESFPVEVTLVNRSRWFPARGIVVKDALQTGLAGAESRCFAATIPAGGYITFVYPARIRRRGVYNITNALLSTRHPFGVFEKRSLARHPTTIVVYPAMAEVRPAGLPGGRDVHHAPAERAVRRRGGGEFHSLRDYRAGDDPRRIAWRASARVQHLVLKEMERNERGRVAVLLATRSSSGSAAERRAALEAAVKLAASLVRHFHRRRRPVLFAAPGLVDSGGLDPGRLDRVLTHLAAVRSSADGSPEAVIAAAGARRLAGMDVLLVTPDRHAPTVEAPGCRIHALPALGRRAAELLRQRPS